MVIYSHSITRIEQKTLELLESMDMIPVGVLDSRVVYLDIILHTAVK